MTRDCCSRIGAIGRGFSGVEVRRVCACLYAPVGAILRSPSLAVLSSGRLLGDLSLSISRVRVISTKTAHLNRQSRCPQRVISERKPWLAALESLLANGVGVRCWTSREIRLARSSVRAAMFVAGLVDHTHPAFAQCLNDAVVREGLSDERVGVRHDAAILGCALGQVNESSRAQSLRIDLPDSRILGFWRMRIMKRFCYPSYRLRGWIQWVDATLARNILAGF